MAKQFNELKERLDKQAAKEPTVRQLRERARLDALKEHVEYSLTEVRRAHAVTQVELAALLRTAQSNVSRIEHGDDVLLSTLRSYVEALGGRLEIAVVFNEDERVVLDLV
jgi:ribosome-binding protein aMBF1 (putative translation factor)